MSFNAADHPAFASVEERTEESVRQSLPELIKTAHYLDGNNALSRTISIKNRANMTGTGANPVIDKALFGKHYQGVKKAYLSWSKYCNYYGNNNFASVQALLAITKFLNGSAFLIRKVDITKPVPLLLQVVSPKMLATGLDKEGKSRYVRAGIMYRLPCALRGFVSTHFFLTFLGILRPR